MFFVLAVTLVAAAMAAPVPNPEDDIYLGLAWHAAASDVNEGRQGKFFVPKEVTSASVSDTGNTKETVLEVIFQESWCSTDEGNTLADVCESMCPIYHTGAQALYQITTVEKVDGDEETHAIKLKDL